MTDTIIAKWQGFSRLSGFERGIIVKSFVALTATWAGLRIAGFRRWRSVLAWLARPAAQGHLEPSALESARIIGRLESTAARNLFFRPNCLEKSMVLWWLLVSRAIPAELHVGARKEQGRFEAHGWVEYGGIVFTDADETHLHFVPFDGPIASVETPSH